MDSISNNNLRNQVEKIKRDIAKNFDDKDINYNISNYKIDKTRDTDDDWIPAHQQDYMREKIFDNTFVPVSGYNYREANLPILNKNQFTGYDLLNQPYENPVAPVNPYRDYADKTAEDYLDNVQTKHLNSDWEKATHTDFDNARNRYAYGGAGPFSLTGFTPGGSRKKKTKQEIEKQKAINLAAWKKYVNDHPDATWEELHKVHNQLFHVNAFERNYDENGMDILAHLIAIRQHDIKLKPELGSLKSTMAWLKRMQKKNPKIYNDWIIEFGDYDNDPNTPDTILVKNADKQLQYVDGYYVGTGKKDRVRKQIYNLYPNKFDRRAFNSKQSDPRLRTLVKMWFAMGAEEQQEKYHNNFHEFARVYVDKHPKFLIPSQYRIIFSRLSDVLRGFKVRDKVPNKDLYLSSMMKTAKFYNQFIKDGGMTFDDFKKKPATEILKAYAAVYNKEYSLTGDYQLSPGLPLSGLKNILGEQLYNQRKAKQIEWPPFNPLDANIPVPPQIQQQQQIIPEEESEEEDENEDESEEQNANLPEGGINVEQVD
jgi:hypothetical protein